MVPAAFYAWRRQYSSEALWAILYAMFWIFGLSWITPYALVTVGNNKWLTRDVKRKRGSLRRGRLMLHLFRRAAYATVHTLAVRRF
ncbi:MAG TPA: hypothetical protein PKW71_11175 [Anaerohalosphaeraceae bacterium]|nr:hypothetical protein [Anaerohalosphaeraceae bacterium]